MRDLSVLSDIEFEELTADLFAAELGQNVERFARGADGGIDLRWGTEAEGWSIGQCKHYLRSTFPQLLAAAKAEQVHLQRANPRTYRFVTSQDLTIGQKDQLVQVLRPWLTGPRDVFGSRDIDGLITRFPSVEQAHPKLWLMSGTQLFWATHSNLATRSSALKTRIDLTIPRYVTNESFDRGAAMLNAQRVCVIAGLPGIGKTTLGYALLANAMTHGFEPIEVSADIDEAWAAYRTKVPQIFLYDDFLGQLTFSERLGKNEDARLSDFVVKVAGSKAKLLVMTTREYILNDARRLYPRLAAIDSNKHLILELGDYSRWDRARILYNHLWHGSIPDQALQEVAAGGYLEIIDHPHYSPRLIEYCTGPAFDATSPGYPSRFLENLEHPEGVWRTAFEEHLTESQQLLAVALATHRSDIELDDLEATHRALSQKRRVGVSAAQFRSALQVLEGTLLSCDMSGGTSTVRFHNPSVRAFVLDWLALDRVLLADVIESAPFFEQIENVFQFATGSRHPHAVSEPSSMELAASVASMPEVMTTALMRLIMSPTTERSNRYLGGTPSPIAGWLENRLHFLLGLPEDIAPPRTWLDTQLEAAGERWLAGKGHKSRALELVDLLETGPEHGLSSDIVERVAAALDSWLATELRETEDDWMPYLERLERVDGDAFEQDADVVMAFESHVFKELDRWHPSPPDLEYLMDYASRFGLGDLHDILQDKARQEDALEGENVPTTLPTAAKPSKTASDEDIRNMFARLGQKTDQVADP